MNRLEDWLYEALGGEWCGNISPPLDKRKIYTSDGYVVSLNNDGFETWIGTPDKWCWHTKNAEFRKIALWHLRIWIFVDWFGLRSWIWYKLLRRQCEEIKRMGKLMRESDSINESKLEGE